MSNLVKSDNQSMGDLDRAGVLRREAELLEQKASVRARLKQLQELSKDPYYDKYLSQMMKDLESGKATPAQVDREAQRSYNKYRQRMALREQESLYPKLTHERPKMQQPVVPGKMVAEGEIPVDKDNGSKRSTEFRIGVYAFSIIGAIFVIVSFVIFSYNFLSGQVQGLCLYGAALILVILSELVLKKRMKTFSLVVTGMGIGGLYAANIVNYLVLRGLPDGINKIVTIAITLLIFIGGIVAGKKKDSVAIRLISLMGCYICFLPLKGIETEWHFLIVSVAVFAVNMLGIFLQNKSKQTLLDLVHLLLNVFFSVLMVVFAWQEEIRAVYLIFFVVTSFMFTDILGLKRCGGGKTVLYPVVCVANGLSIFLLFLIGNFVPEVYREPNMILFVHLTALALVVPVCCVVFLLWSREDGRRWAQVYYGVCAVLLLCSSNLEIIPAVLTVLLITKLMAGHREMVVLDCIVTFWVGMSGIAVADERSCWLIFGALILSSIRIKRLHLYHEIVITISSLLIWLRQWLTYCYEGQGAKFGWFYPVSVGILLSLFLLFNHLPNLKEKNQKFYNVTNVIFMILYYLVVWSCGNYMVSSVMMVLGALTIIIVFRERYGMAIPKKYLVLAGFLIYFTLTGHYESPVIVSMLLMGTALLSVGIGFRLHDKVERLCGLVMAAFVCLKLVLYDFREVDTLYRVIVFLVVGLIALIISFIYIQLEKNSVKRSSKSAQNAD